MLAMQVRGPWPEDSHIRGGPRGGSSSSASVKAATTTITPEERGHSLVEQLRNDENLIRCLRVKRASMLCLAAAFDTGFALRNPCYGASALSSSLNELCVVQSPENKTSSRERVSVEASDRTSSEEKKEEEPESTVKSILRTDNRSPRRKPPIPKSVRWDRLKVDDHAIILGYNPGGITQKGPSLAIGSEVLDTQVTTVDEFEATRGPRRTPKQLRKSPDDREQLLKRAGYKPEEITLAAELAQTIRWSREKSAQDFSILPQPGTTNQATHQKLQASGNKTTSIGHGKKAEEKSGKKKSVFRRGMFYR